jgi:hypothetical protein
MKNLEEYFRSDLSRNVIDHSVRAQLDSDGNVKFYIHPMNVDGETPEFAVRGSSLLPMKDGQVVEPEGA